MSNLFESNAAGVTNFSFEGHCAMTNADEANEVQENVVTAKKGKKRGKNQLLLLVIKNSDSYCFAGKVKYVGGNMS